MKSLAALPLKAAAFGLALAISPAQAALAQDTAQKAADSAQTADPAPAVASTAKPSSLRVMRTGSNIVRNRTDEALPLMEIDRTSIDRTGATTAPQLLRTIPQVQTGR